MKIRLLSPILVEGTHQQGVVELETAIATHLLKHGYAVEAAEDSAEADAAVEAPAKRKEGAEKGCDLS